ncbi:MAG: hypothetical protein WAS27_02995 [Candidatus Saccharimonadales bacterium]
MKNILSSIRGRIALLQAYFNRVFGRVESFLIVHFRFLALWQKAIGKQLNRFSTRIIAVSPPWLRRVGAAMKRPFAILHRRINGLLRRRPHRSFRLTRRRDYKRSLQLPGYWVFTHDVWVMLWQHKTVFGGLVLVYFLIAVAIGGIGQQETYSTLSSTLTETGGELFQGNWGKVGQAGLLLTTAVASGLTPNVTQAQSVLSGLTVFFTWLATVWALRNVMAGHRVKVRDAVYSSGAPVISTMLVAAIIMIQLLPFAIALLVYNAAIGSGFVSEGVESMVLWMALILLGVWSLYWITSTIIALIVVTLPGMYPMQAVRTAGDLVIGRRLRILYRLLWVAASVLIAWLVTMIPLILLDDWIKQLLPAIEWLPTIPGAIILMSSLTIVWLSSYIYMLYRKVVDDDASPA